MSKRVKSKIFWILIEDFKCSSSKSREVWSWAKSLDATVLNFCWAQGWECPSVCPSVRVSVTTKSQEPRIGFLWNLARLFNTIRLRTLQSLISQEKSGSFNNHQNASKTAFFWLMGYFLEFGTSDGLDIAYFDRTKVCERFWHTIAHAGSFKNQKKCLFEWSK